MKGIWAKPQGRAWLAIVGSSTLVLAAAYVMAQQSTRLAADDLPLATAQTVQQELNKGLSPSDVIPTTKTDLSSDAATFVIVTDNSQHVLASSAQLNGKTPLPPEGVFKYTNANNTDHFTWQPAGNARLATRVLSWGNGSNGGYIIAGQSLKQSENRIDEYTALSAAAWIALVGWSSLVLLLPKVQK
jgi:hypothetical protein